MSNISTISAFAAALSLVNAAPTPQAAASAGRSITIKVQLAGFDAASTVRANLDQTTVSTNAQIKEAEVSDFGPWCAGFSDTAATRFQPAVNGDGIFDSANPAIYSRNTNTVTVGSYWCAATRQEVVNFVARAGGAGNANQAQQNQNFSNNNNNNNNANNNQGGTVRVQIELERDTTFVQEELTANGQLVQASATRNFANGNQIVSLDVFDGNCQFFSDAAGRQAARFPGAIGSFRCNA